MNAYELLGIEPTAKHGAINKAYRELAKKLHPDLNAGDEAATEMFKKITAAYNVLANSKTRKEYDFKQFKSDLSQPHSEGWEKGGAWFDFEIEERTVDRLVDLFGDIAGTRLGRVKGAAATSMVMKGQDFAVRLDLLASEARSGVCKLVKTMTGLTVAADIQSRSVHGQKVKVNGFGVEGFSGGEPGDLNVILNVKPDPKLPT